MQNNDPELLRLHIADQETAIESWNTEAFQWPAYAIALATVCHTAGTWWCEDFALKGFRFVGELVGPSSFLLVAVMLGCSVYRLHDWAVFAARFNTTEEANRVIREMTSLKKLVMPIVLIALVIIPMTCITMKIEHNPDWLTRLLSSALFLAGNILLILAARKHCLNKLFQAKTKLIRLYAIVITVPH